MDHYQEVNHILVNLFHDIIEVEDKALITEEFKDISINDMHIIEAIGMDVPKNMSTIAKDVGVTVGTLTIAINNLVKKGYVVRQRGEQDRRVVFLSLSEKGKAAYEHHKQFHHEMTEAILKCLNEEEIMTLMKALNNIRDYFKIK